MAAVQALYAETTTDVTATGTGTWSDCASISAASFTANKKYLILAIADLAGSSSAGEHWIRLVHGTTPTLFTDGDSILDPGSGANGGFIYSWMHVYTQPGTTELVKLQIMGEGTNVATCKFSQIVAINLDDFGTENTDYYFNEDTADYTTTTTPTAKASVTFTPNGTDDWLVIGHVVQGIPSATTDGTDFLCQLYDSVGGTTAPSIDIEAEDVDAGDEQRNIVLMRVFTPSNASHTFSVRPYHAGASFTVLSTRIIALKLNKFAQHSNAYTDGAVSPAAAPSWTNVATRTFTPSVTGNWFYWAQVTQDIAAATAELNFRLQDDNDGSMGSDPAYGDDAPNAPAYDATDDLPAGMFKMKSLSSGASTTVNLDATRAVSTPDVKHRSIVAFSLELAGGGQTVTVNQNAETDTAQAVNKQKSRAVVQNTETDTAQAVGRIKNKAVGQNTETDNAQAIAAQRRYALAQTTETDAAQPITSRKIRTIGQNTEADTAQTIRAQRMYPVGQASETETAQAITRRKIRTVAQAGESDSALALGSQQIIPVEQNSETDTAQAVARRKERQLFQAQETETAQAITRVKILTIQQVAETDQAQSMTRQKVRTLGPSSETDLSQAISWRKVATVTAVTETDQAQPVTSRKIRSLAQIQETDQVQAIMPARQRTIGQAAELDLAQALSVRKIWTIGQVQETDLAQPITSQVEISMSVGNIYLTARRMVYQTAEHETLQTARHVPDHTTERRSDQTPRRKVHEL